MKILQGGHIETITHEKKVHIVPRNFKQDELLGLLTDQSKPIVFTTAGTGKNNDHTLHALKQYKEKRVDKISDNQQSVLTILGFLPDTLQEKGHLGRDPYLILWKNFFTLKKLNT